MKIKKILLTLLALIMCGFSFAGCSKEKEIEFRINGSYIEWSYAGKNKWKNAISIDELKEQLGISDNQVEFRYNDNKLQWRVVGTETWYDLADGSTEEQEQSVSDEIEFSVCDVFVTIYGQAYLQNVAEGAPYQYVSYTTASGVRTAKSSGAENQDESWKLADIALDENRTEVKYVIRVTNDHALDSVTVSLANFGFKAIANTKRYATVMYWDAEKEGGAGYLAAPEANGANETTTVAGDYVWTEEEFTVLPGKYVEFTLTRTLLDSSETMNLEDNLFDGPISVMLAQ